MDGWQAIAPFAHDSLFLIAAALCLIVVFVNGFTDAPNAVASCIATRSLRPAPALALAAGCNLAGILCMGGYNASVAMTMRNLVDLGEDAHAAQIALCAALAAIVLWAIAAWYFGIPTSESHALVAGLSGAAIALRGVGSIRAAEWGKVLFGLFFSVLASLALGYCVAKSFQVLFRSIEKKKADRFFRSAQVVSCASSAMMHGAQDGQKFMGILLLAMQCSTGARGRLTAGAAPQETMPVTILLVCACIMAAGTAVGGKRIIQSVGLSMVRLAPYQGAASDFASSASLFFCSVLGLPVSTTHTKTTAILGAGMARGRSGIRFEVFSDMAWAWLFTFPGCGLFGFIAAKCMLYVF